ncbi:hypothetical protein ACHAW6_014721 [Cyclotella cf. meneghiniana]
MSCSACGLPPVLNQSLQRCSRCKSAWYHDIECQKQHYPKHKAQCRRISHASFASLLVATADKSTVAAKSSSPRRATPQEECDSSIEIDSNSSAETKSEISYKHPLVECKVHDGKGRSLIAISDMYIGCHPLDPSSSDVNTKGWCRPLVPPVLLESERISRCAYCFQKIQPTNPPNRDKSLRSFTMPAHRFHQHCSKQCQEKDKDHVVEEYAVRILDQLKLPEFKGLQPSSAVILCSRILRDSVKSSSISMKFEELCFNINDLSQEEKDHHLKVMIQCSLFLRYARSNINDKNHQAYERACSMIQTDPTLAYKFMSRIMMNGFTISTLEQIGIGIGLYPAASMINHSCRPNALQSFWFFPPRDREEPNSPMLQITTCQRVKAGDEITISYCDGAAPRHIRRKELWDGYKFDCYCTWCNDIESDLSVVGLKCPDAACSGRVVRVPDEAIPSLSRSEQPRFKCDSCGYSRYTETLAELTQNVKNIEATMKQEGYGSDIVNVNKCGMHLHRNYESFKKICNTQYSWYVAWSADAIVNWSINSLRLYEDEKTQEEICTRALRLIDDSRPAMRFCFNHLKWRMLQGIEAKLRLFVNCKDIDAFNLLWDARRYFSLFVDPDSDEVLSSLDGSIDYYSYINVCCGLDPLEKYFAHLAPNKVRTIWIMNGCKDYNTDPKKNMVSFLYGQEE